MPTYAGSPVTATITAYASASHVAGLCQNVLGGALAFSTATSPTLTHVNNWLEQGYSVINTALTNLGYSVPAASSATIYDRLTNLNTLYAAAYTELSRINVTLGPGERTRGQVFMQLFDQGVDALQSMDLSTAGISGDSALGKLYVGGISIDDKETHEDDTDRVPGRFVRGMFKFPGRGTTSKTSDNT